jgi:hypothetical protein
MALKKVLASFAIVGMVTAVTVFGGVTSAKAEAQSAIQNKLQETIPAQVIQTNELDVTGDGKADKVTLFGTKQDANSPYYNSLAVAVASEGHNDIAIPLEGGYNPRIQFCDFNGDKLPEIYVSAETGGSGGLSNYCIYSVQNNAAVAIPIPAPLHVTAIFQKNYVVNMKIEEIGKTFLVRIKDKKSDYDQAGVYKNGKLLKPIAVSVNPFNELKPIDINKDGVCELQGIQRITGLYNADTIGYAASLWKWQQDRWVLVSAEVRK